MNLKIMAVGFYGEGNSGDELILSGLLELLPKNSEVFVTAGHSFVADKRHNLSAKPVKRRGFIAALSFFKKAFACDLAVFSGGILQDASLEGVTFYALRMFIAKLAGCKVVLLGAGLGPLKSPLGKLFSRIALKFVDKAWLRDSYSLELYKNLGGESGKAFRGTDLSWGLFLCDSIEPKKDGLLLINLRPFKDFNIPSDLLPKNLNGQKILPVACRMEDKVFLEKLYEQEAVLVKSLTDFEKLLRKAEKVCAMRYHMALLAARSSLSCKFAPYDSKVSELCRETGIPDFSLKNSKFASARKGFSEENCFIFNRMKQELREYIKENFK